MFEFVEGNESQRMPVNSPMESGPGWFAVVSMLNNGSGCICCPTDLPKDVMGITWISMHGKERRWTSDKDVASGGEPVVPIVEMPQSSQGKYFKMLRIWMS